MRTKVLKEFKLQSEKSKKIREFKVGEILELKFYNNDVVGEVEGEFIIDVPKRKKDGFIN